MYPVKMSNVLSKEDLDFINNIYENSPEENFDDIENNKKMGRRCVNPNFGAEATSPDFLGKIQHMFKDEGLIISGWTIVEYNAIHGTPNLIPHYDRDKTKLIFNFQVSSNTTWGVGVDREVFLLEDNSAVVFNPNKSIHWRPIKNFEPGEYVRMLFVRMIDLDNPEDYSYLPYDPKDPVFDEIIELRNSL